MIVLEGVPLEGVIFDMDGLMFDTETVYTLTWPPAAEEFGYHVTTEQVVGAIGLNSEAGRRYFEMLFGQEFPFYAIRERRLQLAAAYIQKNGLPVKKGLYHLISYLTCHRVPIAVATSSERERAEWYLKLSHLTDCFDAVICGDEVKKSKPDPEIFLKAAYKLHVNPKRCMILEDSENGIRAANATGAFVVMIPDYKQPDCCLAKMTYKILRDLDEVKLLIEVDNNG